MIKIIHLLIQHIGDSIRDRLTMMSAKVMNAKKVMIVKGDVIAKVMIVKLMIVKVMIGNHWLQICDESTLLTQQWSFNSDNWKVLWNSLKYIRTWSAYCHYMMINHWFLSNR